MAPSHNLPSNEPRLTFVISSSWAEVRLLAGAVRGASVELGIPDEVVNHLELCIVEAVNNCVQHAYHGKEGFPIEVSLCRQGQTVLAEIVDRGPHWTPSFDNLPSRQAPEPPENVRECGRGLTIIRSLMTSVSHRSENGTNRLRLECALTGATR